MTFAITLVCSVAACFALRNPLKKYPLLFYVLAVAVDVLFMAGTAFGMPRSIWSVLFPLVQKCMLSLALFVVVMFIGALPQGSKAYTWLKPVRGELSIVAWLLSLGHMAVYLESYVPRIMGGSSISGNVMAAFVLAVVLFVLLLVLGVTSFNCVKKRMHAETWRKVQKLAYPFFLLVYVHLLFMLAPSALHGGIAAQTSVAVYSVLFVAYVVLRLWRAASDRGKASTDNPSAS